MKFKQRTIFKQRTVWLSNFLSSEIKETLPKLHTELLIFKKNIIKFYKQIKKLTPKKFNSYKLQIILIKDLKI